MPGTIPENLNEGRGWSEISKVPALSPFEIHVWRINLSQPPVAESRLKDCLTVEERNQALRFHFAHDQRRFVVRRAILRRLLESYLDMPAPVIRLMLGTNGKPFVNDQNIQGGIRFSCSHSADRALIAFARGRELGADLEQHRHLSDLEELATAFFSDYEIKQINELPQSLKMIGFFNCWTRKEAFVKAIGLGLSFPLNLFSVSLAPGKPAALLDVSENREEVKKWKMVSLDAGLDYSAALVFEDGNPSLQCFEWNPHLLD